MAINGAHVSVSVRTVAAIKLAAVRRQVAIGGVGVAWGPALDKVWDFLRTKPGLRADGHNVFLYHHPARRDMPIDHAPICSRRTVRRSCIGA